MTSEPDKNFLANIINGQNDSDDKIVILDTVLRYYPRGYELWENALDLCLTWGDTYRKLSNMKDITPETKLSYLHYVASFNDLFEKASEPFTDLEQDDFSINVLAFLGKIKNGEDLDTAASDSELPDLPSKGGFHL